MNGKALLPILLLFSLSTTLRAQQDKEQYLQQLSAFERLVEGQTGRHVTNPVETEYLPLLDTATIWYVVGRNEFGHAGSGYYSIESTINNNEQLYYVLFFNEEPQTPIYLREDVNTRKVYNSRYNYTDTIEFLLYDFSMQIGDSMVLSMYSTEYIFLDSIKYYTFYGIERKVFFLSPLYDEWGVYNAIWVEGIGSLCSPLGTTAAPSYNFFLNCMYRKDEILFKTAYAQQYGCQLEYLDQTMPEFEDAWFDKDTVANDDPIKLYARIADNTGIKAMYCILTSPTYLDYRYLSFDIVSDSLYSFTVTELNPAKFWNEVGTWYLSELYFCDSGGNRTTVFWSGPYGSPARFHVSEISSIDQSGSNTNQGQDLYPNPLQPNQGLVVSRKNNIPVHFKVFSFMGKKEYESKIPENQVLIEPLHLPAGLYLYSICNPEFRYLKTGKLIIK